MKVRLAWIIGMSSIILSDALTLFKPLGKNLYNARTSTPLSSQIKVSSSLDEKNSPPTNTLPFRPSFLRLRGGDGTASVSSSKALAREMLAELLGTFFIVFIGTGSVSSAIFTDSLVGLFQIASVWIIAVTIAICTTASISGAHLNPAISIAFAMVRPSKSFNWEKVLPYSVSQCLGAVLGSWLNFGVYGSSIAAFEAKKWNRSWCCVGHCVGQSFRRIFCFPRHDFDSFPSGECWYCDFGFRYFRLDSSKERYDEERFCSAPDWVDRWGPHRCFCPIDTGRFQPSTGFRP